MRENCEVLGCTERISSGVEQLLWQCVWLGSVSGKPAADRSGAQAVIDNGCLTLCPPGGRPYRVNGSLKYVTDEVGCIRAQPKERWVTYAAP